MATQLAHDTVQLTYDDYAKLPNDGWRYEIAEGDLLMSPAPKPKHERVQMRLYKILDAHAETHRLGEVFVAPQDVVLDQHTVLQPDLFFIAAARLSIVTELNVQGPPDLIVEVESDSDERADWLRKLRAYDRHAIKELWHVRPGPRVVDVYRRVADHLDQVARPGAYDHLTSPLLPGLSLTLDQVWA
jgi:Uma2 family endonuclease